MQGRGRLPRVALGLAGLVDGVLCPGEQLGEVDPEKFMPWINDLTQRDGPKILRSKGILAFKDEPKRFVFQGVHMLLDGDLQRDWRPDEKRQSKIVFIGRNLPEEKIRQGFESCVA